ncbi:MAG: hypothetical protein WD767_02770 [Alphaproteobacteria bacterium]
MALSKLSTAFFGSVLAASAALAPQSPAVAQDATTQTTRVAATEATGETAMVKGKPVTLRIGPGFNPISADGVASVLRSEGCPVTVTGEGGLTA